MGVYFEIGNAQSHFEPLSEAPRNLYDGQHEVSVANRFEYIDIMIDSWGRLSTRLFFVESIYLFVAVNIFRLNFCTNKN